MMNQESSHGPLVTQYTLDRGIDPILLDKLHALRLYDYDNDDVVPFRWPQSLKTTLASGDDFILREYQKVMVHHLTRMNRFICGDAVGLGKTIDCIAATCWLYERIPNLKVIVIATKSTTWQWAEEYERFSFLRPFVMVDKYKGSKSYDGRFKQMNDFLIGKKKDILICKYSSMIGKRRLVLEGDLDEDGNPIGKDKRERVSPEIREFCKIIKPYRKNVVIIFDESHKFKTVGSQTRNLVMNLTRCVDTAWALTATAVKNKATEMYSICAAMGIKPFGNVRDFEEEFCIYHTVHVGNGRMEEALKGYQNIKEFKVGIRPFFLGRSQAQVKEPMPKLTTVYHPIDMSDYQRKLLLEDIPNGDYILPPSAVKVAGEIQYKDRNTENMMTMLSVYQAVANHPCLLDRDNLSEFYTKELSPKEDALLDMLDGDFRGEKVIVFTKYRSWIDRLERITADGHFTERKFLRITGAESEKQRNDSKKKFQDPNSGYDLIVINSAAMEGVNLQQAAHMIMLDLPWSWGDLIQLVGRMVRMASPHSACTLHILPGRGTVDEYAIETLKGKKGVFEKILGQSHCAGILDESDFVELDSGMESENSEEEFQALLKAHVKSIGIKNFLRGDQLAAAAEDSTYKMAFEQKDKKKKKSRRLTDEQLEEIARKKW